ncbi:MAG: prolyl-tRNA synthetase associated domain-containing protein [Pseudomonadota bacterium]
MRATQYLAGQFMLEVDSGLNTTASTITPTLADGSAPGDEAAILARLAELGIRHETHHHAPVYTVDEAKAERGELRGSHIKNLFLRNKKGRMWLVTCHEDLQIDLKSLGELVGAGRFSFASAERLMKYLGVIPGAVTPLAVFNDKGGAVQVILDEAILNDAVVNVHPLHNAATTAITPDDLLRFLEAQDHSPTILDMTPFEKPG